MCIQLLKRKAVLEKAVSDQNLGRCLFKQPICISGQGHDASVEALRHLQMYVYRIKGRR